MRSYQEDQDCYSVQLALKRPEELGVWMCTMHFDGMFIRNVIKNQNMSLKDQVNGRHNDHFKEALKDGLYNMFMRCLKKEENDGN